MRILFNNVKFKVRRHSEGEYVNGNYTNGLPIIFEDVGNLQPVSGKELINLPENQRTKNVQKLFTTVELITSNEKQNIKADIVEVNCVVYEVQQRFNYMHTSMPHNKYIIVEVNQ